MKYIVLILIIGITVWSIKGLITDIRERNKNKKHKVQNERKEENEQKQNEP